MDDLRLHAVVARVVAWHNSHPLARRITAAQVNSVGYVALPYTAPGLALPTQPRPPEAQAPVAAASPVEPPPLSTPPTPPPPPAPSEPLEPTLDIDPVIETADDGAIVIDVDPGPLSPAQGDPSAMTLEVELPEPAPTDVLAPELEPDGAITTGGAPEVAPSLPADVAAPADPRPVSALRARLAGSEGHADMPTGNAPGVPAPLPAAGAPRTMVCSEDFMTPVPAAEVFCWVQIHGVALAHEPVDAPVRQVHVDPSLLPAGAGVGRLWVTTAAIEIGGRRRRVLLGGGDEPAVLGRRVRSWPRLLGAVAAPGALFVAGVAWAMWPPAPETDLSGPLAVAPAASAASAAALPSSAAGADIVVAADRAASAVPTEAAASSAGASVPRLPGLLDEAAKAQARATVAALRAERQAAAASAPRSAASASVPAAALAVKAGMASPSLVPPAPLPEVLFGLSTRLLRTRAEAEQLQAAFQALLGGAPGSSLRVEMLPAGEDWRVVCWPYAQRADAERARALLQARGLRVELVDF